MSRIEELESELKQSKSIGSELSNKLSHENKKQLQIQLEIHELRDGVKPGVIVVYRGKDHRVVKVEPRSFTDDCKPWVTGSPMKKDGTFGTAVRLLFDDWELK